GDVLALLADAEVQHTGRPPPLTGYVAEALFSSLTTISFISGFQASRNGVVLRRQLHCAGVFLVSYDYTNGSECELRLWHIGSEITFDLSLKRRPSTCGPKDGTSSDSFRRVIRHRLSSATSSHEAKRDLRSGQHGRSDL